MYKVTFTDNTQFDGGTLNNSKWGEMPNLPIKKLEYYIGNKKLLLEDFESYNHLVEHCSVFGGNSFVSKVLLMGKKQQIVEVYEIDLMKKKGCKYTKPWGQEYNGKPTSGWKAGI